jgi:hypothetical protein
MRVQRFIPLTAEIVNALDHPEIKSATLVDWASDSGVPAPVKAVRVELVDGSAFILRIVGSGGTPYSEPEVIPDPDWKVPEIIKV